VANLKKELSMFKRVGLPLKEDRLHEIRPRTLARRSRLSLPDEALAKSGEAL
jgi:hypothetical protein